MPDNEGRLFAADKDEIVKKLLEMEAKLPCPACGNLHFNVGDRLAIVPLFGAGSTFVGVGYPVIVVICDRCAFMRWHSAIGLGVMPEQKDSLESKEVKNA